MASNVKCTICWHNFRCHTYRHVCHIYQYEIVPLFKCETRHVMKWTSSRRYYFRRYCRIPKKNYWGQCGIINYVMLLTNEVQMRYMPYSEKDQNYHPTAILKHTDVLAEASKLPSVIFYHMMPLKVYSIKINVCTRTISEIRCKEK